MQTRKRNTFIVAAFCLFQYCHPSVAATDEWQGKMKSLAETMNLLMPELVSKNPDGKVIEKAAKNLSELSRDIHKGRASEKLMPPSDIDPAILFTAAEFSKKTRRAYNAIKQGNTAYGKNQLRSITSYCIACHTRNEKGPDFSNTTLSPKTKKLSKQELAELFVATRQFDKALAQFKEAIAEEEFARRRPFEWEETVRNALALAVRVKKDPQLAAQIVNSALSSPALPEFEHARLVKWQRAIEKWSGETEAKPVTEEQHVAQMQRLLTEASAEQLYPADRSSEIQFLRASAAAHDVLSVSKNPRLVAEALKTAGTAYDVLANPSLWPIHEFYYESCVRKYPHTDVAKDCYTRLQQSMYYGYTGSSGTHIPDDGRELLLELKNLSKPEANVRKSK